MFYCIWSKIFCKFNIYINLWSISLWKSNVAIYFTADITGSIIHTLQLLQIIFSLNSNKNLDQKYYQLGTFRNERKIIGLIMPEIK